MPVEQLLDAFGKYAGPGGIPPGLGVNVDGWVLPQSPAEVFADGRQLPAGLIIGINAREFAGPPKAADVKKRQKQAAQAKPAPAKRPVVARSSKGRTI
jgi:hypothetical protein